MRTRGYSKKRVIAVSSYEVENLEETRRLGRLASAIAIPLLCFFAWQDRAIVGIEDFLPARLLSLGLFLLSGLFLAARKKIDRLTYLAHGLSLFGLIAMNCRIVYIVLVRYPSVDSHRDMALNALSIGLFAVYLLAGGLRRFVPLLTALPLAVLVADLLIEGKLAVADLSWFSNPFLIVILVTSLALAQERARRKEFATRRQAMLHLNQLEAFLDAITESLFLVDLEGRVILSNKTTADRLGRHLDEILGKSMWDMLPPEVVERRKSIVEQVKTTGKSVRFEDRRGDIWFDQVVSPVMDGEGKLGFLAIYGKDISALKQREEKLVYLALHDPLTKLANRRSLEERLSQAIGRARRGYPSSLLLIDLDHFKEINDQCGHETGDRVLQAISKILSEGERGHDAAFRIGGDEFAILLDGTDIAQATPVAERFRLAINERGFLEAKGCTADLGLSVGCVAVNGDLTSAEMLRLADEAMYRAKRGGRNRVETSLGKTG